MRSEDEQQGAPLPTTLEALRELHDRVSANLRTVEAQLAADSRYDQTHWENISAWREWRRRATFARACLLNRSREVKSALLSAQAKADDERGWAKFKELRDAVRLTLLELDSSNNVCAQRRAQLEELCGYRGWTFNT